MYTIYAEHRYLRLLCREELANMINFKRCKEIPDVCSFEHCSVSSEMKDLHTQWLIPALHLSIRYWGTIEILSLSLCWIWNDSKFHIFFKLWLSNMVTDLRTEVYNGMTGKTGNLVINFPDRENTGNLIKTQGIWTRHGKLIIFTLSYGLTDGGGHLKI